MLDASVGGLGGCPFAPRATGNVATEDVLYLLDRERVETGVDLEALIGVATWLEKLLGRELPGRVYRAGPFPARQLYSTGRVQVTVCYLASGTRTMPASASSAISSSA